MKPVYYLAVDIGASSGRHILASMDNGRMTIEEVYRFDNGMINDNGNKLWDVDSLFANIIEGCRLTHGLLIMFFLMIMTNA